MTKALAWALAVFAALTFQSALASTTWSTQDYDLYSGDFDGDGADDLLYIAKTSNHLSGIARGVTGGFDSSFQAWPANFLGILWSGSQYKIVVLQNKAATNRRADILLQSIIVGGNTYLLKPNNEGRITAIAQTLGTNGGLTWSADQHRLVAGDFNGDGFADVFLQAMTPWGQSAVVLADSSGQFTAAGPAQPPWSDGFLGFKWAASEAIVYAGDFNGDGRSDLLIQAKPAWSLIDFDVPFPVPTFPPNMNGVTFAHTSGDIFSSSAVSGLASGYYAWSRKAFGVDWSPLVTNLAVGQFSGSTYSDILLQALHSNNSSYLVTANGLSSIFATGSTLASNVTWSADTVRMIAGKYAGGPASGIYFQAVSASGTNSFATSIAGASVATTTHDPTAPPPGTTLPMTAGSTPTSFAVSESGAATYNIPIWAPPGIGALQLKLALNYNSRSPNGVMGVGWTISGLSSITRCNRTWAQDGGRQGVALTIGDRLCLDGQQLKVISGSASSPAQGGTTYSSEIESFSQIVANGAAGSAPTSFTVTTKNGLIFDYGLTDDSRAIGGPGAAVRTWALSQMRDRVGNIIKFSYYNDASAADGYSSGGYRLKEIDYPYAASGQGPFYKVIFGYVPRPTNDQPTNYFGGFLVKEQNKLDTVTVKAQANGGAYATIKTYGLVYRQNPTTNQSLLVSVQECSVSSCLPTTEIGYQGGSQGWAGSIVNAAGLNISKNAPTLPVDLDGDGRTDLLYPVSLSPNNVHWWVAFGQGVEFLSPIDTGIISTGGGQSPFIVGAFSGTGQNQFLAKQGNSWFVYSCTPSGCTSVDTHLTPNGEAAALDWDGDGLPDLVSTPSSGGVVVRRNITQPGGAVTFDTTTQFVAVTGVLGVPWNTSVAINAGSSWDFNGDGRADLIVQSFLLPGQGNNNTSHAIYRFFVVLSNGFGSPATNVPNLPNVNQPVFAGDWNGDGCSDIISSNQIWLSNCAGGFTTFQTGTTGIFATQIPIDWDGDGRTDIIYNDPAQNAWYLIQSTGDGAAGAVPLGVSAPVSTSWFVVDQNGDGLADLAYLDFSGADANGNSPMFYRYHYGVETPANLATSFSDGFGIRQDIGYGHISGYGPYTKCTNTPQTCPVATFPEQDYQGPLYVVKQVSASDGTGSSYGLDYWYYGARVQAQGRGFEGFYAQRITDSRNTDSQGNALYSYEYYKQAFPYTGLLVQRLLSTSANVLLGTPSAIVNLWTGQPTEQLLLGASQGSSETRHFPYLQSSLGKQYELGALSNGLITTTSNVYTYGDGYGNQTSVQTTISDNDPGSPFSGNTYQTIIGATYLNDTSATAWCLGLPTQATVTSSVEGQASQTRTYGFVPDTSHQLCRQHQRIIEPNAAALNVTNTLSYDACGNISQIDVAGHNFDGSAMPTRSTYYNYSYFTSRCQFPESVIDALGNRTTVTYQYDFGVPLTATDPNLIPVSWTYDDFGRTTQERRADNTSTMWSFKACTNAPCWGFKDLRFLAIQNEFDANGANFFSRDLFYDGIQRLRFDESNRVFGTWTVNTARTYDSLGRVVVDSLPFALSAHGQWKYSYDLLSRITSAQLYRTSVATGDLDRIYSRAFAGRKVQLTDPLLNVRSYVGDVLGNLRRVIDPLPGNGSVAGATTKYDYDDFGNLSQVTDAIGAVWGSQYNLRGFRTRVSDPDSGVWNFNGDSLNEVTSWTDAKNQSFQVQFDALGRVFQRTEPEGTSTFTFGSSAAAHNIGALQRISGYGYAEDLTYDNVGRLVTKVITTDQAYQYDYSYNSIGAVDTVTYPQSPAPTGTTATRVRIQYGYSYGSPVQISDITQATPAALWNLSGADDFSSPTNESLGSGALSIARTYTPWTEELTGIQSGVAGSASNRQNLSYQRDTNGNLHSRSDANQTLTEVFGYDSLNRPTSSTLNNSPNFSVGYTDASGNDQAGNIKSRGDVGSYTYGDPSHPHGVTSAGGYHFTYDPNGNVSSRNGLTLNWASFNLPISLQATVSGGTYSSQFSYGPEHQRYMQSATYSNGTEVTYYVGGLMEKVTGSAMSGVTSYRHYVPTPSGVTIVVARKSDLSTNTTYALSDHLGSSDMLVNGTAGSVGNISVQESFGAFGQRRASNWGTGGPSSADWTAIAKATRRGFTFHEHLDNIGLTHMNGRVYDPTVGRFLSVDPVIGDLSDSQSANPYAYVGNRPLSAIDPSGYIEEIIISAGNPYAAVAFAALDLLGFGGLFGGAPPPPPPAAAQQPTAQSTYSSANACAQASNACSGQQYLVASDTPSAAPVGSESLPSVLVPGTRLPPSLLHGFTVLEGGGTFEYWASDIFTSSPRLAGPKFQNWQVLLPFTMLFTLQDYYIDKLPEQYKVPAQIAAAVIGPGKFEVGAKVGAQALEKGAAKIAASLAEKEVAARGAIGATGRIGEAALKNLGGESQVFFRTSQGARYVDQLVNGIANESKVGYQSLNATARSQIAKDAELIQSGQIQGAAWHFFRSPVTGLGGPSGPLADALRNAGIDVVIH